LYSLLISIQFNSIQYEQVKDLFAAHSIDVYADESFSTSHDLPSVTPYAHGVNIKLEKTGGIAYGLATVTFVKQHHIKIWIGQMLSGVLASSAWFFVSFFLSLPQLTFIFTFTHAHTHTHTQTYSYSLIPIKFPNQNHSACVYGEADEVGDLDSVMLLHCHRGFTYGMTVNRVGNVCVPAMEGVGVQLDCGEWLEGDGEGM
jgi:hypothetical protein